MDVLERREELFELARATEGDPDRWVEGIATMARADVDRELAELHEHQRAPEVGTAEWYERAAEHARRLASAAAVVADYEREKTPTAEPV